MVFLFNQFTLYLIVILSYFLLIVFAFSMGCSGLLLFVVGLIIMIPVIPIIILMIMFDVGLGL